MCKYVPDGIATDSDWYAVGGVSRRITRFAFFKRTIYFHQLREIDAFPKLIIDRRDVPLEAINLELEPTHRIDGLAQLAREWLGYKTFPTEFYKQVFRLKGGSGTTVEYRPL